MTLQKMIQILHLSREERPLLVQSLKELEKQGAILRSRSRYFVRQRSSLVKAKLISVHPGYGFARPEDELLDDIFIPARYSGGALQGDFVEVFVKEKGPKKKNEGRVVKILERGQETMIGIVKEQSGRFSLIPYDSPLLEEVPLSDAESRGLRDGIILKVDRNTLEVKEILGFPDDEGVDTDVVIQRFGLTVEFSKRSLSEAQNAPMDIRSEDLAGRKDYRNWAIVTIDGPDAQDFDDAVSIRTTKSGNFFLGVHIADVCHYIQEGSFLDQDAFQRGTSVYFPDRTLPMFPEKISNNICSLRPKEDKLTISVTLEIDREGRVVQANVHPSIIRTEERMTYDSVYKIFQGDGEEMRKFPRLVPDLLLMRDLAHVMKEKRRKGGSLDFDLVEPELVYEAGKLHSVVPLQRNTAHQVIEEFMVAANEAVASFLIGKEAPLIFRVHPPPRTEDLRQLREILLHFGIFLPDSGRLGSKDLQSALDQAEGRPDKQFVESQVLKSLRWALYSADNHGHFGLAKKEYTHFTSPIRRYPDLFVHRILKRVLEGERVKVPSLAPVAQHCSDQERKAEEAERNLVEWRIFRLLKSKLGSELDGIIVDMSPSGLVVELSNFFVEGKVPSGDLSGDYFYHRGKRSLVGRQTGHSYALGQKVRVVLASVDTVHRRIILSFP